MASLLDRTGVACATTLTGPLTLGSALGAVAPNLCSFMDFATAGAVDGKTYRYLLLDANGNWEFGKGVYTASGTTLTRVVKFSSNGNAAISLSGSSQVFVSPDTDDILSLTDDQTGIYSQQERGQGRANLGAASVAALAANVLNINAGMEVSQENGTTAVTLTATSTLQFKYIVDGVMAAYRGTFVASGQQVTDAPVGYSNSVKVSVTTAQASMGVNDEMSILIPVEGVDCAKLAFGAGGANALAVFFWAKKHRAGTYSASARNGGKTRSYPFAYTINAADTWEYKSVVIPGDTAGTWLRSAATVGLYLSFNMAAGSSRVGSAGAWAGADYSGVTGTINGVAATTDVMQITGASCLPLVVGLTLGDLPDAQHSAFLVKRFAEAQTASQRFYAKSYPYAVLANGAAGITDGAVFTGLNVSDATGNNPFPVPMCGSPQITFYAPPGGSGAGSCRDNTNGGIVTALSAFDISERGWNRLNGTGILAAGHLFSAHYIADKRL